MKSSRSVTVAALMVFGCVCAVRGQDMKLREEAINIVQRGTQLGQAAVWGTMRGSATFRATMPDGKEVDGSYSILRITEDDFRIEVQTPDFHAVWLRHEGKGIRWSSKEVTPPAALVVLQSLPGRVPKLVSQDVVRAILTTEAGGRVARCIEFDSITGEKTSANQICADAQTGAILSVRRGAVSIGYSRFFPYHEALIPGLVVYTENDLKVEMEFSVEEEHGPVDPAEFEAPPGVQLAPVCREFRAAIPNFAPQPEIGSGKGVTDVVVRAGVRKDGTVSAALVQSSSRPDLNEEALRVARRWTFAPEMCNGKPGISNVAIVLHFQGR